VATRTNGVALLPPTFSLWRILQLVAAHALSWRWTRELTMTPAFTAYSGDGVGVWRDGCTARRRGTLLLDWRVPLVAAAFSLCACQVVPLTGFNKRAGGLNAPDNSAILSRSAGLLRDGGRCGLPYRCKNASVNRVRAPA
jgi:hypothetical protein